MGRRRRRADPGPRIAYGSAWLPGAQGIPAGAPVRPEDIPPELLGRPAPFPDTHPAGPPPLRSFDAWLAEGYQRGWVSEPFCAMHHTEPMTPGERAGFEAGADPCTGGCVRLWPLTEHADHHGRDTLGGESGGNPTRPQGDPNG